MFIDIHLRGGCSKSKMLAVSCSCFPYFVDELHVCFAVHISTSKQRSKFSKLHDSYRTINDSQSWVPFVVICKIPSGNWTQLWPSIVDLLLKNGDFPVRKPFVITRLRQVSQPQRLPSIVSPSWSFPRAKGPAFPVSWALSCHHTDLGKSHETVCNGRQRSEIRAPCILFLARKKNMIQTYCQSLIVHKNMLFLIIFHSKAQNLLDFIWFYGTHRVGDEIRAVSTLKLKHYKTHDKQCSLVVDLPLWKIWKSVGMIVIPNMEK